MNLERHNLKKTAAFVLIAVACFHLAFASIGCELLVVGFLYALLRLTNLPTPRQAFYVGLGIGFAIYAPHLRFFWDIFGVPAIALWGILAAWLGIFLVIARACRARFGVKLLAYAAPFLWTGVEYFRSELYPLKFSWLSVGLAFSDSDKLSLLANLGVYGIGFVAMATAGALLAIPPLPRLGKIALGGLLAIAVVLPGPRTVQPRNSPQTLQLAGIQLEFPGAAELPRALDHLARRFPEANLFVLSEYTLDGPVPTLIKNWCKKRGKYLLVGGKEDTQSPQFFNTAFVVGPDGEVVFKQAKSVPIQFFKDGLPARNQNLWDSPWGKLGIAICYDASYTRVLDRLVRQGAQALIIPTMDISDWGEYQHKLHARIGSMRAAEYRVPVFRLCSSGVSQVINAAGTVLSSAPTPGQYATIGGRVALPQAGRLPMDRWLSVISVAITFLAALGLSVGSFRRKAPSQVTSA